MRSEGSCSCGRQANQEPGLPEFGTIPSRSIYTRASPDSASALLQPLPWRILMVKILEEHRGSCE